MTLLIHHHAPAYREGSGIWVQSFIGAWVEALSEYCSEIGLLLPVSAVHSEQQDTFLDKAAIRLHGLPEGGRRWDYLRRRREIASICQSVSPRYEVLLVRGITPRQWTVWKNCRTRRKAFLLVGSLRENRPAFGWQLDAFLTWALSCLRRWEFAKIAAERDALLLANSPQLVREIIEITGVEAHFVPTNTLRPEQILPFEFRETSHRQWLFVGRVVRDKGIEDLIAALAMADAPETTLKIIGAVTASYRVFLEQLAVRFGVADRIVWQGFVPFGDALLAHYRSADFLVLPSWHEGFPHCIWEAAASSTPVVVTPVGGIPGLVDESGVTFIAKNSPADIAEKIEFLIQNPALRCAKALRLHAQCREIDPIGTMMRLVRFG